MQRNEFLNVIKVLVIVMEFVNVPVPPLNPEQRRDNVGRKTILDNLRGVAADNRIGRDVFDNHAVRRDNSSVADNQRLIRVARFENTPMTAPNVIAD